MKRIYKQIIALVLTGIITATCTCGALTNPKIPCTCEHHADDILPEKKDS